MIGENKILLMKFNGGKLNVQLIFDGPLEAQATMDMLKEQVKISNSISGTYYLIPAQEIKIVRE